MKINIGTSWGRVALAGAQMSMIFSLMTMTFSAIAAYPWITKNIVALSFVAYIVLLIIFVVTLLFCSYFIFLPSYYKMHNKQVYDQNNPMVRDIEQIKKDVEKLLEKNVTTKRDL